MAERMVLVMGEDEDLRLLLAELLRQHGYTVVEASDGEIGQVLLQPADHPPREARRRGKRAAIPSEPIAQR
jgi:CheY-like chemotaxis protein